MKELAEIAIRQAEAGDFAGSARTSELALAASENKGSNGVRDADKSRPDWLAALAAAQVLRGDPDGAEAVFAEAATAARRQASPAGAMRAIAEAEVRVRLLVAADRTIADLTGHDLFSADHGWEAAATLVTALAARGNLAAAASVLDRVPDFALCYPRAVRALAQAVARTGPAGAEELAARLPEQSRDRALHAVATAALSAGHRQDAERIADAIEVPSLARPGPHRPRRGALVWRTRCRPASSRMRYRRRDRPCGPHPVLAEYAVTRGGKDRPRLLAEAKRLVRKADRGDRWSVLAEIAMTEAEAD